MLLYLVVVKIDDGKAEVVIPPDQFPMFQAVRIEAGFFQIGSDIWMLRLAEEVAEIDVLDRTIVKAQAQLVFPDLGG
jgi:hypothetical protein